MWPSKLHSLICTTRRPDCRRLAFSRETWPAFRADDPVVLAWMPAAAVYFRDPDNNLLEFITMLPDPPRPDLGVLPWSDWLRRTPPSA